MAATKMARKASASPSRELGVRKWAPGHRLDPKLVSQEIEQFRGGLETRVIGQPEAIEKMVMAYQLTLAGLTNPKRPIAVFLFLGPTGVGKTRLVEAAAETLVGDSRAMVKIDCGEFQHSHEVAKLVGSPPGYLGHKETHPMLSQQALNQYHTDKVKLSFVLFDEIEKANDSLQNLLLGIMDKATLTLGDNSTVDFSRAMIFMTSNLGAREMQRAEQGFGLAPNVVEARGLGGIGKRAATDRMSPEFMNRVDHVVVFNALGPAELRKILEIELAKVQMRLFEAGHMLVLNVTEGAKEELLREGTSAKYGARPLTRTIERRIVLPLSNLLTTGQIESKELRVDFWEGEWEFWGEGEEKERAA